MGWVSKANSAAQNDAEKEADPEGDAYGLKGIFANEGFSLRLVGLRTGGGVTDKCLRLIAEVARFDFCLIAEIAVGGGGSLAEIARSGTEVLLASVESGFGLFDNRIADCTAGFCGGVEGLFGVFGATAEFLVKERWFCFGHDIDKFRGQC